MKYGRLILGALGAILLATAGEGLWELVVKPVFPSILNGTVWLSTLGINKLEDSIYREIGAGNYERTSLQVFLILYSVQMFVPVFLFIIVIWMRRFFERNFARLDPKEKSVEELREERQKRDRRFARLRKKINYLLFFLIAGSIFVLGASFFSIASTIYEVRAEANIRQLMLIDDAYVENDIMKQIKSQAAQIKNKKDYQAVIDRLREIAIRHGIEPPLFDIMP